MQPITLFVFPNERQRVTSDAEKRKKRRGSLFFAHLQKQQTRRSDLLRCTLPRLEKVFDNRVQDDFLCGVEDEANVVGVGRTRKMCVDRALRLAAVLLQKLIFDVLCARVIVATAFVVGKTALQVDRLDLLLKEVLLVEEEDDGRVAEPVIVNNLPE